MCAERNLAPKFQKFTNEPGYWKLLIDRKMINNKTGSIIQQKAVQPVFDQDTLIEICDEEVANFKENNADFEEAVNAVVEAQHNGTLSKIAGSQKVQQIVRSHQDWVTVQAAVGINDPEVQLQARSSLNDGIELTAQEFAMFYDKWGEMKADKSAAFEKTSDGYYIFAIGDKLVYTNGNYDNPKIAYAVEIALADETNIDTARHLLYETERGEISYEQTRRILEDLFGEENVRGFDTVIHRADERKNRRGKGATRREIYRRTESEEDLIYQARPMDALSDREILANALEDVAATPEEKLRLAAYKEGLAALNEKQAELDKNKTIIRELMFKKGRTSGDSERLLKARNRAEMLAKEVDRKDKALLNLERMEPIKAIVKREGDKVRKERNAVMKERIADVRQTYENAALRKSIARRVKKLNDTLINPTDTRHVPDEFRFAVLNLMKAFTNDRWVRKIKRVLKWVLDKKENP